MTSFKIENDEISEFNHKLTLINAIPEFVKKEYYKTGTVITDVNGEAIVVFDLPFDNTQYSISLTPTISLTNISYTNKAASGFRIVTSNADVSIFWLAMLYDP